MRKIVGHWIVSSPSCCRETTVTKFAAILIPIRTTGEFWETKIIDIFLLVLFKNLQNYNVNLINLEFSIHFFTCTCNVVSSWGPSQPLFPHLSGGLLRAPSIHHC